MKKRIILRPLILVLAGFLLLSGCNESDSSGNGYTAPTERGTLLKRTYVDGQSPEELAEYLDGLDEISGESRLHGPADPQNPPEFDSADDDYWARLWSTLGEYFQYSFKSFSVTYSTIDHAGNPIEDSGLVVVPERLWGDLSVPILALQHPTQTLRKYSPSICGILDPEITVPVAYAIAATGYIVVIADYTGMGVNYDVHPYCQNSLSYSVVDLIRAAKSTPHQTTHGKTRWDGRLFLMGYSEGGYATLVTAKDLQRNHAEEFTVTAVAGLDGPYSLSGAMRNVMINAGPAFAEPYFLPYFVNGYDNSYKEQTDDFDFDKAVIKTYPGYAPPPGSNYAEQLKGMLNGEYSGKQINEFMESVNPYQGPKSILTDEFVAILENPDSKGVEITRENNAYEDWVPLMPLKMFHCLYDDLVPVENAQEAYAAFKANGAGDNVEAHYYKAYIPGLASIHGGACPVGLFLGYLYLDKKAYPSRHGNE